MAIRGWKAAAASLAVMGLGLGQVPASAAPAWATDHFKLCLPGFDCGLMYIEGWITWGNRTASVVVDHHNYGGNVTGHFTGYAGSTKVDNEVTSGDTQFVIGNPNLPGGINRIKSQACVSGDGGAFVCTTPPWHDIRD